VAARWLSLVESLGYPLTDVETVVRDEAVTTLREDDPLDEEEPTTNAADEMA
jgi:hypothetical protein